MARFSLHAAHRQSASKQQPRTTMAESKQTKPSAKLRALKAAPTERDTATERLTQQLQLANLLHSTLDLNEVLRLFALAAQRAVGVKGLAYRHEALGLTTEFAAAGL